LGSPLESLADRMQSPSVSNHKTVVVENVGTVVFSIFNLYLAPDFEKEA
jgi:hypothetical protein